MTNEQPTKVIEFKGRRREEWWHNGRLHRLDGPTISSKRIRRSARRSLS